MTHDPERTAAGLGIYPPPFVFDDNREGHEGGCTVFDAVGNVVSYHGDMEDNTWQDIATGHLFAAAPDLYDALAELVDALSGGNTITTLGKAQAALKKATGKP